MGIWSEPVFAVCYNKEKQIIDSEKVILTFPNKSCKNERIVVFDDKTRKEFGLASHGVIIRGKTTFKESIMAISNCAKIYGYFDKVEVEMWNSYFSLLFNQNPDVFIAAAHFYCIDDNLPFYIISKRDKPQKIQVFGGTSDSQCVLYTDIIYDDDKESERDIYFEFNKTKYIDSVLNHWKTLKLCMVEIETNIKEK